MASEASADGETIEQAVRRLGQVFRSAGIGSATGDARRLIAAALGATADVLIRDSARVLTEKERSRLDDFARRRASREPVSRILGEREFYGRRFAVTPAVLDPRPDTETLIDVALELGRVNAWHDEPIRILDLGTGSGAILLTLLAEFSRATGLGIDISRPALACAEANAQSLGLSERAQFEQRDMLAGLPQGFDLVVSNPPYIPARDIEGLDPEVAIFDPRSALDGGIDGLRFYRSLLAQWVSDHHEANMQRILLLEIGAGQSQDVNNILIETEGYKHGYHVSHHRDLSGHIRCVAIQSHKAATSEKYLEPR